MENKKDMIAVIKIIGIATSIGKAGIDFDEGQKQCKEVMKDFETQIRQDQKEKNCSVIDKIISGELDIEYAKKIIMEADQ